MPIQSKGHEDEAEKALLAAWGRPAGLGRLTPEIE
jgi:hypothetical protein